MQCNAKDVNWLYRQPEKPEEPRLSSDSSAPDAIFMGL